MKVLSLCSGYGGLELALGALFPGRVETTAVCDNYAPARAVLAKRFSRAAQYPDVADPLIELENADVVTFGFPCQDLSRAGTGAGLRGNRSGLFFRCAEIGHLSGARSLVIENVPQARRYRATIDAELRRYGFATRWGRSTASEAGLPHRRDRVFIVADRGGGALPTPADPKLESVNASYPTPTVVDMGWGRTERVGALERGAAGQARKRQRSRAVPLPGPRPTRACRCLPEHGGPDGSPPGVGHRSGAQHLGPAASLRKWRGPRTRGARHLPGHHKSRQLLTSEDMQYITVFHQPNCQPCRLTMRMLDKLGAAYVSHPLDDGSREAERVLNNARALGMTSAPIVEVRDEHGTLVRTLSGYRPADLREIVRAAR